MNMSIKSNLYQTCFETKTWWEDSMRPGNWKMIMSREDIEDAVARCADALNNNFPGRKVVFVCLLKGAVYFFVDLTRKLKFEHSQYHLEVSSYKDSQTQEETVEILSKIIPSKFKGRYVVLVDELYDRGTTMDAVKKAIHEQAEVPLEHIITCTCFVKRHRAMGEPIPKTSEMKLPDLYGEIVNDVFYVGYGLDDQQTKRDWINLYACPKVEGVPLTQDDIEVFGSGRSSTDQTSVLDAMSVQTSVQKSDQTSVSNVAPAQTSVSDAMSVTNVKSTWKLTYDLRLKVIGVFNEFIKIETSDQNSPVQSIVVRIDPNVSSVANSFSNEINNTPLGETRRSYFQVGVKFLSREIQVAVREKVKLNPKMDYVYLMESKLQDNAFYFHIDVRRNRYIKILFDYLIEIFFLDRTEFDNAYEDIRKRLGK